jgi:hypothetical protein
VIFPRFRQRLCLAVDLCGYSRHTSDEHIDGQTRLVRVIEHAVRRTKVVRIRVQRQDQGDGLLAVFPPDTDDMRVVPALVLGLRDGMYQTNRSPGPFGRMRMRSAIGRGSISRSPSGYVGDCVITVSRMIDSVELRNTLVDREHSDLALAITPELHTEVIAPNPPGLPASEFTIAELANPDKEVVTSAWMYVPRSAPARDLSADAVRWGYSPTRTAMQEFVVPALSAAHLVATVGHMLAPSSPLREWLLPAHDGPNGAGGTGDPGHPDGLDSNFDEVDNDSHHHDSHHQSADQHHADGSDSFDGTHHGRAHHQHHVPHGYDVGDDVGHNDPSHPAVGHHDAGYHHGIGFHHGH